MNRQTLGGYHSAPPTNRRQNRQITCSRNHTRPRWKTSYPGERIFYGVPPELLAKKTGDYWDDLSRRFGVGVPTLNQKPGSGSNSRWVVSNLHVFKRAWTSKAKVVGSTTEYPITRIVGIDIKHVLCVFEIDALALPPLMLADPEKIGVGDDVYAGGNPRGLENTLSRGIISGIHSDEGLVQIDAAI